MATKKITFDDKEAVIPPGIRVNQVWDQDINEIKDAINKNADVQIIHEESINNIISSLNNRLVSIGTISASGLIITIPSGANWIYNGVSYKTNSVTTITETLCATGFFRKDILVCNQYNQIVLIKGTESETIVIRPNIPIGTIFITEMYINDSVIGEPAEPITNNDFIKKQEKAPFQVWNSGEINNTYLDDFYYGYLNFRAAVTNLKSIGTYTNAYLYSGKEILIKNSQSTDITIYNLTGDGFQFSFPNENNFILKPNEIIRFSLKILSPTEGILEYVGIIASTSFSGTQDDVPDGTTYKQYSATEKAKLTAITGTNTGDETASSIITKIGDGTKINSSYLPSYVDDVLEFANLAAFSGTGESGKIYVAIDSSKQYRWTGSAYLQITNGLIATSNDVPEGVSNLYFTTARVLATLLTGISFVTGGAIVSTDSVLVAFGKIQKQITDALTSIVLKADIASPTFTGTVVLPSTTSIGTVTNTELSYVDGVTSSIQTQLNGKQSTLTNPVTGTGTTNYIAKFTGSGTVDNSGINQTPNGYCFSSGLYRRVYIKEELGAYGFKSVALDDNDFNRPIFFSGSNVRFFSGSTSSTVVSEKMRLADITGNLLVNTDIDNGVDVGQFNGSISATVGITANQVVIKSQLDTKSNLNGTFKVIDDAYYNAFPGCVKMANDNIICVYRKGTSHASDKGDIVKITTTDSGRTWSSESILFSHATLDVRDPSITLLRNNSLVLTYFTYNISTYRYTAYVKISIDNGITWGGEISVGGFNYDSGVSSPVIQLDNNDLLLSLYGTNTGDTYTSNVLVRSINNGISWTTLSTIVSGVTKVKNYSEPSLVLLSNGSVLALNRNETDTSLESRISIDNGATWGTLINVRGSLSRASLLKMDNNDILMSYRSANVNSMVGYKPAICSISKDGVNFGEESLLDVRGTYTDTYSSIFKINSNRYGIVYCEELNSNKSDVYFRYINETELVKDVALVQGVSSYGNSFFKKSIFVNEDIRAAKIINETNSGLILGLLQDNGGSGNFSLYNNAVETIRVLGNGNTYFNGGNIMIGSTSPATTPWGRVLQVYDSNNCSLSVATPSNTWHMSSDFSGDFFITENASTFDRRLYIKSGGNIGIGYETGTQIDNNKLAVNGNILATSYSGGATLTGTPTAPTAAPGTNDNTIANTAFVQAAKKYKTYIGILNQSSTSAPTVTVIDNELSSAIVWTYSSVGGYVGTLIGAFTNNKTSINFTNGQAGNGIYGAYRISDNAINITSSNSTTGIASDGLIWNATIEVRVYN